MLLQLLHAAGHQCALIYTFQLAIDSPADAGFGFGHVELLPADLPCVLINEPTPQRTQRKLQETRDDFEGMNEPFSALFGDKPARDPGSAA